MRNPGYSPIANTGMEEKIATPSRRKIWGIEGKTVWDFLQLLLLPLLITFSGYIFQYFQQYTAEKKYREESLQLYYQAMSTLILEEKIQDSNAQDQVRDIARANTLTVLRRLDGQRQGLLILFLKESELITLQLDGNGELLFDSEGDLLSEAGKISLSGANLEEAELSDMDLRYVSFWHANLVRSNLKGADLRWANLSRADLRYADLEGANVEGAYFTKTQFCRTVMEDGEIRNDDCR